MNKQSTLLPDMESKFGVYLGSIAKKLCMFRSSTERGENFNYQEEDPDSPVKAGNQERKGLYGAVAINPNCSSGSGRLSTSSVAVNPNCSSGSGRLSTSLVAVNAPSPKWTWIGAIAENFNPLSSGTKRNLNNSGGTNWITWIVTIMVLLSIMVVRVQSMDHLRSMDEEFVELCAATRRRLAGATENAGFKQTNAMDNPVADGKTIKDVSLMIYEPYVKNGILDSTAMYWNINRNNDRSKGIDFDEFQDISEDKGGKYPIDIPRTLLTKEVFDFFNEDRIRNSPEDEELISILELKELWVKLSSDDDDESATSSGGDDDWSVTQWRLWVTISGCVVACFLGFYIWWRRRNTSTVDMDK